MTTASIVSKVWSFCNPFLRKPKKAPKGRNIRTMGAAHRNKDMQIAKALKGRNNTRLKN